MASAKKNEAKFTVTLVLTQAEGAALELLLRTDRFPEQDDAAYDLLQDIWSELDPFYPAGEDA